MFVCLVTFIFTVWDILWCKALYLKWKRQFYTNSQSLKQVVDISSQDRLSYGRLFFGSKLIPVCVLGLPYMLFNRNYFDAMIPRLLIRPTN